MAETLGIIASGIAVGEATVSIGVAIMRLKQLLEEMEAVPNHISDLMSQIECLSPAIWEIGQDICSSNISTAPNGKPTELCAVYGQKALKELTELADELMQQINSPNRLNRKLARFKAVLKGGTISKLERRLEATPRMLPFAQQSYTITLIRQQPQLLEERVIQQLQECSLLGSGKDRDVEGTRDSENTSLTFMKKPGNAVRNQRIKATQYLLELFPFGRLAYQKTSDTFSADFRPPSWITNLARAFSLQLDLYSAGWKFHFQTYSIRPWYDSFFEAAQVGDVQQLQAMLSARRASPFDVDTNCNSLLHVASYEGALPTVELLVQLGYELDLSYKNNAGYDVLSFILKPPSDDCDLDDYADYVKFLVDHAALPENDLSITEGTCNCPNTAHYCVFRLLQPVLCPFHQSTLLETRLKRARLLRTGEVEIIRFILEPELSIDPEAVCNLAGSAYPLIHTVARKLAGERISVLSIESTTRWHAFAKEVITRSKNVHLYGRGWKGRRVTPLMHFIWVALSASVCRRQTLHVRRKLHQWLDILKAAGVDLIQYGSREKELFSIDCLDVLRSRRTWLRANYKKTHESGGDRYVHRIIGFQYGAESRNWDIWWNEPTDDFAGDFWALIEAQALRVPGEWVESDEPDYDDDLNL